MSGKGFRDVLKVIDELLRGRGVDPFTRSLLAYLMHKASVNRGNRLYLRLLIYVASRCGLCSYRVSLTDEELDTLRRIEFEVKEYFSRNIQELKNNMPIVMSRRYSLKFSLYVENILPLKITEITIPNSIIHENNSTVKSNHNSKHPYLYLI